MKYDSYPRFLKSDEYNHCWDAAQAQRNLPEMTEPFLSASGIFRATSAKSLNEAEKGKKKSILHWPLVSKKKKEELGGGGAGAGGGGSERKKQWMKQRQQSMPSQVILRSSRSGSLDAWPDVIPHPHGFECQVRLPDGRQVGLKSSTFPRPQPEIFKEISRGTSGNLQGNFRKFSRKLPEMFKETSGNLQGNFRKYSRELPEISRGTS
jgi:hypothetical protein